MYANCSKVLHANGPDLSPHEMSEANKNVANHIVIPCVSWSKQKKKKKNQMSGSPYLEKNAVRIAAICYSGIYDKVCRGIFIQHFLRQWKMSFSL